MNRIVLIGNGFDLAHGLPTGYHHFLNNYWQEWYERLCTCVDCKLSDEFYEFAMKYNDRLAIDLSLKHAIYLLNMHLMQHRSLEQMAANEPLYSAKSFNDLIQLCDLVNLYREEQDFPERIHYKSTSQLFTAINNACKAKWVDIENEYYRLLKQVSEPNVFIYGVNAEILNTDLSNIKDKLTNYLNEIQADRITVDIYNENIKKIIFEPFNLQDISNGGTELFLDNIGFEVSELPGGMCQGEIEDEMKAHPEYSFMNTEDDAYRAMIEDKYIKGQLKGFDLPNKILLLNFNYTNTAEKLYAESENDTDCESIYIHGKLNDPNNPVIFGYGDEMDEHYKEIVNLNNNDYLQNIKSIRYLETDNYRNLLSFIDSEPYQIYIMGHSCGNSDRTLLNTLFEHENCVSIKPFYYIDKDSKDNYIDIIQNISRNFKDATLMRDRVVNKGYCEPLPQNIIE